MNRLNIGSGRETSRLRAAGWVTLDADPQAGADIAAPALPLPEQITGQQWDCVEMIHFIEHLYHRDAVKLVTAVYQILKPGGVLITEQPNLEYAARALLGMVPTTQQPRPFHDMYAIYGHQNGNPHYQHLWGYTPHTMTQMLIDAGFKAGNIHVKPALHHWPWRDFRVEAIR